ncbi:MAG: tRNA lysidine(34) synthetase TilS [Elusimicrobiota bacterium]
MLQKNDRILVGLSGGPDSVFLTVMLNEVKNLYKIKIFVCNIDHQYRKNSWKDTKFVKKFCEELNVPVTLKKIKFLNEVSCHRHPPRRSCGEKSASGGTRFSEEKARNLRYKIFENVAKKYKCNKIATGHTLNDNAETVLMWIARDCGIKGLKGIPPVRGKIIRPILCASKKEIISYLKRNKIKYCIDSTNFSTKFTRNRIRLNIIPQLEKINPEAARHIFELAEKLRNKKNIRDGVDTIAKNYYNKKTGFIPKETSVFFDAAKIDIKKIKIRKWHFGDKMVPFGMNSQKKLQDVFTDEKIPRNIRKEIPVVCEGKKIVWVSGVKRSNDAKLTNSTKEIIKMELKK